MKSKILAAVIAICSATWFSGCSRPSRETPRGAPRDMFRETSGERSGGTSTLKKGSPAPAFKLPDLDGRQVSLDQYRGKVVLLDFWATWCTPCQMTMPVVEQLQNEYPNNLVLLAINLQESRDEIREFIRQQDLNPSHVLLDEEGSLGQIYGTEEIPLQVLIDKQGIVQDIITGFNPRTANRLREEIEKLR